MAPSGSTAAIMFDTEFSVALVDVSGTESTGVSLAEVSSGPETVRREGRTVGRGVCLICFLGGPPFLGFETNL